MATALPADELLDADTYLSRLGEDEPRQELIHGRIVMMTGGRRANFALSAGLLIALGTRLAGKPCRPYGDGAFIRIDDANLLSPDVFVDCSPFDPEPRFFEAPVLIAEVLSESTEARDRGEKWRLYRRLPSLRHYLLVARSERRIEHYARDGDVWRYEDLTGDAGLRLEALAITLPLAEVYAGIVEDVAEATP
ncbi:MAG TPA: Uma2 family endonuclease [Geminicoccaceae bacterium]